MDDLISVIKDRRPDGDALDYLTEAVVVGEHLGEQADLLVGHFVALARVSGATWSEIGQSLGVTKQAAQKRFVRRVPPDNAEADLRTFARYTDEARAAVVQAQQEAQRARHDHIGPEHITLALLHQPETSAAKAIEALGVPLDVVRESITSRLEPPSETAPTGPVPFAAQGKQALELTHAEALRLGHDHVGVEHVLLGLLSLGDGPVVAEFARLGVTKERVEQEMTRLLGDA
ncbi:Clp protease N-terminal domain-containing protein [Acrocarpospora macrocephala]|uniref:Clp R domain-containing protein n=1 Tax=Acrocarpospora macrocephala TaxID=150177 RepID=A0A5M3X0A1_9ACTN|nr:hypothetical protein Amac_080770 [Acrocarpospora macrocephala]